VDREKLAARLRVTFLDELVEIVRAINRELLALERAEEEAQRSRAIKELFRAAHSLKGAAHAADVRLVERACHGLESLLAAARDGTRALSAGEIELIFTAADAIAEAGQKLREGASLGGCRLELLLPRIDAAATGAAPGIEAPPLAGGDAEGETGGITPPSRELTVRVRADKLDALLAHSGELLVARGRLDARADDILQIADLIERWEADFRLIDRPVCRLLREGAKPFARPLGGRGSAHSAHLRVEHALVRFRQGFRRIRRELDRLQATHAHDIRAMRQAAALLEGEARRVRMVPLADACEGLDRAARDIAKQEGKQALLSISGCDIELDRAILEGLKLPLLHLVRNAVSHGIEPTEERRAAGKSAAGHIRITAALRGAHVDIAVSDDGRGLDVAAIREQVRKKNLPEPADDRELVQVILEPGFSTARLITDISGRGVGLDVVKERVEALHGSVGIGWTPRRGAVFTLTVPLTLTTLRALVVKAAGQTFALPGANVVKLLRVDRERLLRIEGLPAISVGGRVVPVASLAECLGLSTAPPPAGEHPPVVVVAAGEQRAALFVEDLVAEQEIVVKALGRRLEGVAIAAGATFLPTGRIALILNVAAVVRAALRTRGRGLAPPARQAAKEARKRLLVVEDTITTRSLLKSLLEAEGYGVSVAGDGAEALRLLHDEGADLVVADIEMPRMDGFELTAALRASPRFRALPVVLVTGLESDADKARGVEVGADAYLVKSGFDQRALIETIEQLV
jgi:two-component system chemotaxis sensor kinase CheA